MKPGNTSPTVWWLVTLEGFPAEKQLASPLTANNPAQVHALGACCGVVDAADPAFVRPDFWERTILGLRRPLADLLRLQLYGVMWSATGIDQSYPAEYPPAAIDLEADESFHDCLPPTLDETSLSLDVLHAGGKLPGESRCRRQRADPDQRGREQRPALQLLLPALGV